jgi:hypothetical protein
MFDKINWKPIARTLCQGFLGWGNTTGGTIENGYTMKKVSDFPVPAAAMSLTNSRRPGRVKLFPARESLLSDILAGEGKIAKQQLQCRIDK